MSSDPRDEKILSLESRLPRKVGKYIVTRELGYGTTGTVYLCHDPWRGRDVALKLYFDNSGLSEKEVAMRRRLFFNEAQLAGLLDHPNILPILDAGDTEDARYVVMEYISGAHPLSDHCNPENLLPVSKVVDVVFKCARALAYAHRQGVIHRDIKPGNILLTRSGDVRLVDFGVARTARGAMAQMRGLIGSPSYMAPEQLAKNISTRESDLFSLGVVLYELLAGKRPFYGDNLDRLREQIMYATPVPVHRLRADVPPALGRIVDKALQKQPSRRYRSGLEFAADLARVFEQTEQVHLQLVEQERFRHLRHLRFFRDFAYPDIWEILNAGSWETFAPGEAILSEGELDDSFFVLVAGTARVESGRRRVGVLAAGDCVGESGYLEGERPNVSIVAETEIKVLRLHATAMENCSTGCQLRFLRQFLRSLIGRLSYPGRVRG
jgi:serine/threonine protein kinase